MSSKLSMMAVLCWVFVVSGRADIPNPLTFCASADNLPMSQESAPNGFESELAGAIATNLGHISDFVWLNPHTESLERALLDRRCDAALGAIIDPGQMAGDRSIAGIVLTRPYYRTGYVLIRHSDAPPVNNFATIPAERIAVERESIATYSLRQSGQPVYVLKDYEAVLQAVSEAKVRYGYIWGPLAFWHIRERPAVMIAKEFQSPEQWRFAFAVRQADVELLKALNGSIERLLEKGVVAKVLRSYGIEDAAP